MRAGPFADGADAEGDVRSTIARATPPLDALTTSRGSLPGAVLQVLSLERQAEAVTARIGHGADVEVSEGDNSTGPEPSGGERPNKRKRQLQRCRAEDWQSA